MTIGELTTPDSETVQIGNQTQKQGLHVLLLNKFSVQYDSKPLAGFESRKAQELFAYLLMNRERAHLREGLVNLLWPEKGAAQAKKSLRQAIWQLQNALDVEDGTNWLLADSEWVQLNPAATLHCDALDLGDAYEEVQDVAGDELTAERIALLEEARLLYVSDFLEGFYSDWCLYQRERLRAMYLAILHKLMLYCKGNTQYERGIFYGGLILGCDPALERTHRWLMQLHYLAGDRTGALRQYQECVHWLAKELDVEPSHRTVALYEQIRLDLPVSTSSIGEATAYSSLLAEMLKRMRIRHKSLVEVQRQLGADISSVEQVLHRSS